MLTWLNMSFWTSLKTYDVHNNVLDCIIVFHSTNMLQLKFSNAIKNIIQNLHFFSLTSQCLLRRIVLFWMYNVFSLTSGKTQFSYSDHNIFLLLIIYVDDLIITGNNSLKIQWLQSQLCTKFAMSLFGPLSLVVV